MLYRSYYKKVILLLLFVSSTVFLKDFQKIDSYSDLTEDFFRDCNEHTLVTFDVDDTLVTTLDFIARDLEHSWLFYIYLAIQFPQLIFNSAERERVISIIVKDKSCFVFDKTVYDIIKKFKQLNCTVLAFTDMRNASFGVLGYLPEWRAKSLQSLGFDFSCECKNTTFDALNSYKGSYPCLYSGVLCTNKLAKGEVLGAFIDHFSIKPNKIISFDDLFYQLSSIEKECKKRKIAFTGIQPLRAKKLSIDRSFKKAALQIDNVLKTGTFFSNRCSCTQI
jgi:hypothetical protein